MDRTKLSALTSLATRIDTFGASSRMRRTREGWASRSRSDVRFARIGGVQFRYRERGLGPRPIVLAADPPVTLELYDELLEAYSAHFRVVVLELPAMGFSVAGSGFDFAFASVNDTIAAFLEQVVAEPAVLAFSCVAGLGAIDIAGRRPELVSHVVTIQTPSWGEEVRWKRSRDPQGILGKPFIGQLAMKRLKANRAPKWFDLVVGRRDRIPTYAACASETLAHGAGWALASAFQHYLPDAEPPMATVRQPMLALWGLEDGSHRSTDRRSGLWLSGGEEGRLVEYEDLGHFPELEDVSRVLADVCAFVEGKTRGPADREPRGDGSATTGAERRELHATTTARTPS